MQHLSSDMYNNEQISKVLFRNSAEICLKMDYFASKSTKFQSLGDPPPDSRLDLMTRKCAKTLLPLNIFG